jgi:hypothetical protein
VSQQPQPGSAQGGPQDLSTAVVGGGLGAIVAGTLPGSWFKTTLIVASPIIAVGLNAGGNQLRRWNNRRLNEKRAKARVTYAEAILLETMKDENATPELKDKAREQLAELRQLNIDTIVKEARIRLEKCYDEE